jgi:hypothetical protein
MELTEKKLTEKIRSIIKDYESFRRGTIDREKLHASVGFHISSLREYEMEEGHYGSRSVAVVPSCSPIVDLCLLYNMEHGPARYILSIRPEKGDKYSIHKNKLYYLDSDKYDVPFKNRRFASTMKYQKEEPSRRTIRAAPSAKSELTTSSGTSTSTRSKSESPSQFSCAAKNRNCCYLMKNHPANCKDCCKGLDHYAIPRT